ncbi:hypothetical protein [Parapedobacter indicus]|uniref:F5/8 type C domain-containing protein n=1 Tax=Parapedobacter indicus TaxID=1477437 RepID=A0A1I3PKZ3_9SPHI|nr:hypothetical protein [Parapedobacter indicus]PPL00488.1 hypothetical protein CLV26_10879 [Parapedobacter indicus]SFJ22039.1 hypothetical protein SAMN05444682_10878 [Parapedobacter indicus]
MNRKALLAVVMIATSMGYADAQSSNIAQHKSVSGFPVIDSNPFEYVVDGNDVSCWYLPEAVRTKYIEIDLDGEYRVDRVLLKNLNGIHDIRILARIDDRLTEVFKGGMPYSHLITFDPVKVKAIRLEFNKEPKVHGHKADVYIGEIEVYAYEPQPVMVNQTGYNTLGAKRFTAPLAVDGTSFKVVDSTDAVVFSGTIAKGVGDFSNFRPDIPGPYWVEVRGDDLGRSFPFRIEPYLMERASYFPAMAFMADTRCWYGNADEYTPTEAGPGCPFLGVAWRDSHQFSFELPVLISMYFANPQAFSRDRMPEQSLYRGLREDLPAETPEIVKMIYWAVDIYLKGEVNHTLLKSQLAWFVYAWPHLSEYIPRRVYDEAVAYLFPIWGNSEKGRWHWHDIDHSADLFQTYTILGSGKGQFPPGFSIIPNLMMYEVAKRENRKDADRFFEAAYKQTAWLITNLDWRDPATTKGQRMNEYITLDALSYFLKKYPKRAPKRLAAKLSSWADVAIERADNYWDYRKYAADQWTIPDIRYPDDPKFNPHGSFNEVGNIAGFPVPALAAAWAIEKYDADRTKADRLRVMATAHIDHVFGRNPNGRHFSYDAVHDFEGADLGWFREYDGGAGMLQTARGVLDGSVKEPAYPYHPYGGDPGHTEGWVTFNTAWIMALAYQAADVTSIEFTEVNSDEIARKIPKEGRVGVRLHAPLNLDPNKKEKAFVQVIHGTTGEVAKLALEEKGVNGHYFDGELDVHQLPFSVAPGTPLTVCYGLEHFRASSEIVFN